MIDYIHYQHKGICLDTCQRRRYHMCVSWKAKQRLKVNPINEALKQESQTVKLVAGTCAMRIRMCIVCPTRAPAQIQSRIIASYEYIASAKNDPRIA